MKWRSPTDWDYPQLLLVGLGIVLGIGILVGLTSTGIAFGAYNPTWDGASDLRDLTATNKTDARIIVNTTAYSRVDPNTTIAIVLSPPRSYSTSERARMRAFVRGGGTLVVAEDFGPVGNQVLRTIGASTRFDGRLLRDEHRYARGPEMVVAPNVSTSLQARGVEQVTLNRGTVLRNVTGANPTVLVRSSEYAYLDANQNEALDENETVAQHPIVMREQVGAGTVVAVSDPSLFINAMLEEPDNRAFVQALLGRNQQVLLDYSQYPTPPLSLLLVWLRQTPLLQVIVGVVGVSAVMGWYRRRAWMDHIQQRVRGDDRPDLTEKHRLDEERLIAYLQAEHPEWDQERIDRVITGILVRRRQGSDNDRDESR